MSKHTLYGIQDLVMLIDFEMLINLVMLIELVVLIDLVMLIDVHFKQCPFSPKFCFLCIYSIEYLVERQTMYSGSALFAYAILDKLCVPAVLTFTVIVKTTVWENQFGTGSGIILYSILVWRPSKGQLANSADPDQMLHDVASDQGFHCSQIM